jgi:predicted phage tail protein
VLTYTDSGLTNGSTYWYQVAAVNAADAGPPSNAVSVTPQRVATAPSAPLNLVGTKLNIGIRLTWSPPSSDGGSAVTDYRVLRGTVAGGETFLAQVAGSQLTYTDSSVQRHTRYFYVVVAVNAIDQGPRSNEVNVRSK